MVRRDSFLRLILSPLTSREFLQAQRDSKIISISRGVDYGTLSRGIINHTVR